MKTIRLKCSLLELIMPVLFISILWSCSDTKKNETASNVDIKIEYPSAAEDKNLDGRLILLLAEQADTEPRFQLRDDAKTCQAFGMDVENWNPNTALQFDAKAFGYPIENFSGLPSGDFYVQAVFHKYETFNRADGLVVKLPMDRGEGQQWNKAPGNLYSTPKKVTITNGKLPHLSIVLDQKIPPIAAVEDTKYIKHIKIKSKLLSEFWGRDMYLGAHVLLPEGWETHPDVKYPLAIMHGHYPKDFDGFRTTPPDPNLEPEYSERFDVEGYNRIVQQEAYDFYKTWTGPDFPRVIAIKIQHPTPYYDDSYAVNSAAQGPYGDAITYELIPHIEKQFRGIGEGWSRFVYGGSTGGWESLAVQVKYPKEYGMCFAACPDPIDFRAYCLVNIYEDENAYYQKGTFRKTLVPGHRDYLGNVDATLKDMNYRELVLGSKGRSGQQWDIWEATYSPIDKEGYPKRIWDRLTGEIDKEVAEYWKENYDLADILKRDWAKHGKDWENKIHIYCGDMDNYYLNNAVYLAEDILSETTGPYYNGEVDYGDRAEHCWNGDHDNPNHISRLRYHRMFIKKYTDKVAKIAPEGADLKSWRY
ncbi:alpha/beta hydrolase-fold protein [Aquimarina brevivitae]|uniref:Putative esterase n=1 Tax=Aquimarina brevivitae TaxID=323412 RepID=A0A4V2F5C1_9FLAO|nr:alpha/beta hydrolase-fold protein [Aquimarina brevivitae]RZS92299.1 putative esterase [Aquimarina brevivitae]